MKNTMKNRAKRKTKRMERGVLLYVLAGSVAAILIAAAVFLVYDKVYYGNRWYRGTMINGVDVSGQTLEQSRENMMQQFESYALVVSGRGYGKLTISGTDIDYRFNTGEQFDLAFREQHQKLSLIPHRRDIEVQYQVSYDLDKLQDLVKNSELMRGGDIFKIKKPKSAYVEYSEEKQQYILVEEVLGNELIYSKFMDAVEEGLQKAQTEMDITTEEYSELYKAPKVFADNEELQTQIQAYNQAALRFIEWNIEGGETESITPNEISQWISYKSGKIKYDNKAVEEWVEKFCLKYKTVGANRMIKSHTGKKVEIKGGDYGWQLDYEKTLSQAKKALKKDMDAELIDAYIEDPSEENKKALTMKRKVNYLNTAFQMSYGDSPVDWDTENYIEVSLKEQKVYVFRKGKVAFSCRCISGRPVEGRTTPTGAFYIKEHRKDYTMTGEDYETPVKYWVRITWTGTGFHPATWQPWSRWSKDLYKTKGSHGCINLSPEDAEKMYGMTPYRQAVFIY